MNRILDLLKPVIAAGFLVAAGGIGLLAQQGSAAPDEGSSPATETVFVDSRGELLSQEQAYAMIQSGDYDVQPLEIKEGKVTKASLTRKAVPKNDAGGTPGAAKDESGAAGGSLVVTDETVIRDPSGNTVTQAKFIELISAGTHVPEKPVIKDGRLMELTIRPATAEEQKSRSAIHGAPAGLETPDRNGQPAPDFTMTDLEGTAHSLKDLRGKVVVMSFWFAACKPCVEEIPGLNKLVKKYKANQNVVFLAPTFEDTGAVGSFRRQHPFRFRLCANAGDALLAFGVSAFPTNIVLDRTGAFQAELVGGIPGIADLLDSEIQKALAKAGPAPHA